MNVGVVTKQIGRILNCLEQKLSSEQTELGKAARQQFGEQSYPQNAPPVMAIRLDQNFSFLGCPTQERNELKACVEFTINLHKHRDVGQFDGNQAVQCELTLVETAD